MMTGSPTVAGEGSLLRTRRVAMTPLGDAHALLRVDGSVVVGRHPGAEISVADPAVSLRHAEIRPTDDGYEIRDLGSLNGTWVNGKRVGVRDLRMGDEIRVGNLRLRFLADDEPVRGVA